MSFLRKKTVDNEVIIKHFLDALEKLWGKNYDKNRIYGFITDKASYMVLAGQRLKNEYNFKNMKHIYCMVHSLHNVSNKLFDIFSLANEIVSLLTQILCKSRKRRDIWGNITDLAVPKSGSKTRFGIVYKIL